GQKKKKKKKKASIQASPTPSPTRHSLSLAPPACLSTRCCREQELQGILGSCGLPLEAPIYLELEECVEIFSGASTNQEQVSMIYC
ncbi:hypothetical protein, partial [Klebsiella pneumoniae]|uniref:hypothetical protein n=1 Tax=Klebsiella pneumoniae TaxID=573 RepID=UPI001BE0A244